MAIIASIVIITIIVHALWFTKRRSMSFPPIGSRWCYSTYMQRYVAEVVEHHPFTGEITILRTRDGEPRSLGSSMRVNAEQFISAVTPYRAK
jgi:FtsZ-interacting cell division protein ZipA